jgi:hypothetical protein
VSIHPAIAAGVAATEEEARHIDEGRRERWSWYTANGDRFDVDFHTALVVALLIEGGITVDVGRCPACVKRGGPHEWLRLLGTFDEVERWRGYQERNWEDLQILRAFRGCDWLPTQHLLVGWRPCPACSGTGRDIREAARIVLDAVWRTSDGLVKPAKCGRAKCHGCGYGIATTRAGLIRSHTGPGPGPRCSGSKQRPDTAARDSLHVKADDIQRTGDPLGEWLSLWLAGSRERTDDMTLRLMEVAWRAEIMHGGEPSRGVG